MVSSTGELTTCNGSVVKGWPGSMPGRVGPRPEAKRVRSSLDFAGFASVTRLKSPEWTTAGPLAVITISGRNIGTRWTISVVFPPPKVLLLDGSSVTDAERDGLAAASAPDCPSTPRNAPLPPVTTRLPRGCSRGAPGDGAVFSNPLNVMEPLRVPSGQSIVSTQSR